jgi:hypothetical protein
LWWPKKHQDQRPKMQNEITDLLTIDSCIIPALFHLCRSAQESLSVMKNTKYILLMLFVVSALLVIGCSKAEETTNRNAAAPTAPATASPAATTTTTASATEIGIPECDAFLKAYETCVNDKVPANIRASFQPGIASWKKSWHDLAANPQTKPSLVAACKSARDNASTSMKAYGCAF